MYLDKDMLEEHIAYARVVLRQVKSLFWREEDASARKTLALAIKRQEDVLSYLEALKSLPQV